MSNKVMTLKFVTREDGIIMVTCKEHPLLALTGNSRLEAFCRACGIADEMEIRNKGVLAGVSEDVPATMLASEPFPRLEICAAFSLGGSRKYVDERSALIPIILGALNASPVGEALVRYHIRQDSAPPCK